MEEKKYSGKIAAVSSKNKSNGSIGFLLDGDPNWFNINATEEALDIILKATIVKGNKIEFLMGQTGIENLKILEAAKIQKDKNWAEDMTNFEDLLTAAHEKGLISITTELIQIDPTNKFAVFKATVLGDMDKKGKSYGTFTGYGDAEGIDNEKIKPHWVRMAETRAIVRALRWYTNNATVAEEETGK
jgi:hypothetical protein